MDAAAIIALLLVTAAFHAAWNMALKTADDRVLGMAAMRMAGLVFAIAVIPLTPLPAAGAWPWLAGAALLYMAHYALLISAYGRGDLAQVYPIARGTAPLLAALGAMALADEQPAPAAMAGIAVISAGILLAGSGHTRRNAAALVLAAATGLTVAANQVMGGVGVRVSGTVLGYAAWLELLSCVPFLIFAGISRGPAFAGYALSAPARRAFLLGMGGVIAYLIALWAMTRLPIATVTATRETSVIFAALAGTAWLGEAFAARRIAAAMMVVAGTALLVSAAR